MDQTLISIIMPVYNDKENVLNAIDSIINQTYKNWELIIIDDCSRNGTYEKITKYIKKLNDKRIILKRNRKNLGCYVSMNVGLLKAKGKYITRMDSDDTMSSIKLEVQANILDNKNNIMCVESYYKRGDKLVICNCITMMFRKDVINTIGYYDSVRFAADTEFKYRMYKTYGLDSFYKIKKPLYFAKIRPDSLTRSAETGGKELRLEYKRRFQEWHKSKRHVYMDFPLKERPFPVEDIMLP